MRKVLNNKLRKRSGFTLAEVLMAVLIVAMVSAVVAAGIPSAVNAYHKITDAANADLLLSTTMTRLRDQLGTAKIVDVDTQSGTIIFRTPGGTRSILTLVESGTNAGIWLQEYDDIVSDANRGDYHHLLVSDEAASRYLHVTYELGDYDATNGIVTFTNLAVKKGSETVSSIPEWKVRILAE